MRNRIRNTEYLFILPCNDISSDILYVYAPRTFSVENIKVLENIDPYFISKYLDNIKQQNDKIKYVATKTELKEAEFPGKYERIISPNKIMTIPFYSDEYYYLYKLKY